MKKEIYIHVGLPKTATTFLQKNIFRYCKDIYFVKKLPFFTSNINMNKILISNEALSGSPQSGRSVDRRDKIIRRLKKLFPEARIVLGLREKQKWTVSLYRQYVRQGGVCLFEDWFNNVFDHRFLDFDEYISLLDSLFPEIYVYQLKDFKLNCQRSVSNLCSFLEISVPQYNPQPMHVSYNEKRTELIRKGNHLFKSYLNTSGIIPIEWKFMRPQRIYDTIPYIISNLKGINIDDYRTDISYITKRL